MKKTAPGAWQTDHAFDIRISIDGAAYSLSCTWCSPVAQLVEQATVNRWVAGSSPAWGAITTLNFQISLTAIRHDGCHFRM